MAAILRRGKVRKFQFGGNTNIFSNAASNIAATRSRIQQRQNDRADQVNRINLGDNPLSPRQPTSQAPIIPPTSRPSAPNDAVGSTRALNATTEAYANPPGGRQDPTTGFGSGNTSVAATRQYMDTHAAPAFSPADAQAGNRTFSLPSGGFAAVGPAGAKSTKPLTTGGVSLSANQPGVVPQQRPFVYGGRVDMTPPGKVGFKRPGPFKMGGRMKVEGYKFGGRARMAKMPKKMPRKMQDGGTALDFDPDKDVGPIRRFFGNRPTPTPTATPSPRKIPAIEGRKMQTGGVADDLQSRDREGGPVSPQEQDTLFRAEQAANEERRARTLNEPVRNQFLNRVKGVASAVANSTQPDQFRRGGKVRKMQDGGITADIRQTQVSPLRASELATPPRTLNTRPNERVVRDEKNVPLRPISEQEFNRFARGGRVPRMQFGGINQAGLGINQASLADDAAIRASKDRGLKNGGKIEMKTPPREPLPPDTEPAMLGKGEAVLNKNQQKRVVVQPGWQKGLNSKEKSAMASMNLPRMPKRVQRAMYGKTVPRIFGGK